jgi:hypothetical protein
VDIDVKLCLLIVLLFVEEHKENECAENVECRMLTCLLLSQLPEKFRRREVSKVAGCEIYIVLRDHAFA